jgi:uncharacterized protein YndB with AHSA1/START domain
MITVKRVVTVDKPVSRVADYLTDFTSTTEWDPGTVRTVRVSGDGGVGTRYENTSRFAGRETRVSYVVEELVPGRTIALRGENATMVAHDTMTFSGDERSTEVSYVAEFELKGLARFAEPLLRLPFKKLGDDAEKGLREALSRL